MVRHIGILRYYNGLLPFTELHELHWTPEMAPPWRFFTRGRASVSGIASGSVQRAPRSQVVVPGGRLPGPPGASGCEPPPQDATPRSAFRIVSRRRPSMSAADGPYTLASLRSQYINSLRSRKCSQPFAAAVEKWIVADHRRACPRLGQGCKHAIDTAFGARIQSMELQSEGMAAACRSLVG